MSVKTYHELMRELVEDYMPQIKENKIPLDEYRVWYYFIDAYPDIYTSRTRKLIKTFSTDIKGKVNRVFIFLYLLIIAFLLLTPLTLISYHYK